MRLPSGASPSRLHRHLPAVRLVSRYFPPLHVARWRYFGASPLRQSTLFRRKIAHPSADAGTLPGSEYLHSGTAHRLCGVCATPPHAGRSGPAADAPCPPALFVVYPVSFLYGASLNACASNRVGDWRSGGVTYYKQYCPTCPTRRTCLTSAELTLEPSGAAGWGGVVLHGTPEVMARHSVRMSRRIAWARQAMRERIPTDMTHRQVPNEGRDPKTLPRPSRCEVS